MAELDKILSEEALKAKEEKDNSATLAAIEKEKAKTDKKETFVNPFNEGVTYVDFLNALGKKSVEDYCKGKIESEEIEWLKNDLEIYKKTTK